MRQFCSLMAIVVILFFLGLVAALSIFEPPSSQVTPHLVILWLVLAVGFVVAHTIDTIFSKK